MVAPHLTPGTAPAPQLKKILLFSKRATEKRSRTFANM